MTDTTTDTIAPPVADRVAAGAAWLDTTRPGWESLIDLDRLSMTDCNACVLGQSFGDYWDALDTYGPGTWTWDRENTRWAIAHGFQARDTETDAWSRIEEGDYDDLADAWAALILDRATRKPTQP